MLLESIELKEGRRRAIISNVSPKVEEGRFAIKRIIGDYITIWADIFSDGHSLVAANLLFRHSKHKNWQVVPMIDLTNDRWQGQFQVSLTGFYFYTIHAWVNYFKTWQQEVEKKFNAGIDVKAEIAMGLDMIQKALQQKNHGELKQFFDRIQGAETLEQKVRLATEDQLSLLMRERYPNKHWVTKMANPLSICVDPPKAQFSTWYEIFPRSFSPIPGKHGTFKDCQQLLPRIAEMGFDVLYFPPIHPIGHMKRKGKQNQPEAQEQDPGSPWAIGSYQEGHKSIHPNLGSLEDFEQLISHARHLGIDIALDIAFQCSLDHPYLKKFPSWFRWHSDGSIQYAENPPKKYEDIVPFCFETEDWRSLWEELRSIFVYWIEKGIQVFRVDNPHTKPFPFWEWAITTLKQQYPDVIFLSEAFTRPKVMYWLAKLGFTQSYTYFTWRHTKQELTEYLTEITSSDLREFFRPNFWVNTPDILSEELQHGGRPAFMSRLVLAATLCSNYGMYAPAFELMESHIIPGTEEYLNSEKYQLYHWDLDTDKTLRPFIRHLNKIRKQYPALHITSNLRFLDINNESILYYVKLHPDARQSLLILVNLDPQNIQSGLARIPLEELKLPQQGTYQIYELLSGQQDTWEGELQHIRLEPEMPAHIFSFS